MLPDVGPEGALQLTSGSAHLAFQASLGAPSKAKVLEDVPPAAGWLVPTVCATQARSLGVELDDTIEAKKQPGSGRYRKATVSSEEPLAPKTELNLD
jgi:hypothetical protein